MSIPYDEQNIKIDEWKKSLTSDGKSNLEEKKKILAERIIQIRNIAAIIQYNRPDIILLNEFNNDGAGSNLTMQLFAKNYLSYSQSLNSVDGGDKLNPISYPYMQSFATNTGLIPDKELNFNFDNVENTNSPDDAYGFGYYHGHYAFGVMSMYPIDESKTRTFQNFKWKDMEGAENPKIVKEDEKNMPKEMKVGDNWFSDEEWNNYRLSSKNHVDLTVKINNQNIHLLMSHPTPPSFDTVTKKNQERNYYEVKFWQEYINNKSYIYDDKNVKSGIDGNKEKFIIMGDQNADPLNPEENKSRQGIDELLKDKLINQKYNNEKYPMSNGGAKEDNSKKHPKPESRTSVFGLRVDYAIPSHNLDIIDTGVYWVPKGEKGDKLFYDNRIGKYGNSKEVSSDHRLVWTTVRI